MGFYETRFIIWPDSRITLLIRLGLRGFLLSTTHPFNYFALSKIIPNHSLLNSNFLAMNFVCPFPPPA